MKYYIILGTTIIVLSFAYVYSNEINAGIAATIE
jgi:hypothetical protein